MATDLNILIGGAAGQGVHAITGPLAKALVRHFSQVGPLVQDCIQLDPSKRVASAAEPIV